MDSTNPSTGTPRKRSRDIDDDTYTGAGASHSAIHISSPPAPKRRSVSPTVTPAGQAALPDEQVNVHQAFALGADYVFQYIRERGYFALGEDLRAKIADEMQDATADSKDNTLADSVAEGIEKHAGTGAKGFWDVV